MKPVYCPIDPPTLAEIYRLGEQLITKTTLAHNHDKECATDRECDFLASLILNAGETGEEFVQDDEFVLCKKVVEEFIRLYKQKLNDMGINKRFLARPRYRDRYAELESEDDYV